MSVQNVLAGVAVTDIKSAAKWYELLIGQPGKQPMKEVFEWSLPNGGVLQLLEDSKRAGSSSVTFSVSDIDSHVDQLAEHGVAVLERSHSRDVSTAILQDPDGNRIVLAEPHSDKVAR